MGTIRKKALKRGANSYTAQIVRRKFDYTESRTFDTTPKAERWMKKREKEIDLDIEQGQNPSPFGAGYKACKGYREINRKQPQRDRQNQRTSASND